MFLLRYFFKKQYRRGEGYETPKTPLAPSPFREGWDEVVKKSLGVSSWIRSELGFLKNLTMTTNPEGVEYKKRSDRNFY